MISHCNGVPVCTSLLGSAFERERSKRLHYDGQFRTAVCRCREPRCLHEGPGWCKCCKCVTVLCLSMSGGLFTLILCQSLSFDCSQPVWHATARRPCRWSLKSLTLPCRVWLWGRVKPRSNSQSFHVKRHTVASGFAPGIWRLSRSLVTRHWPDRNGRLAIQLPFATCIYIYIQHIHTWLHRILYIYI